MRADRLETLLSAGPLHSVVRDHKLRPHPAKLKDGSPRDLDEARAKRIANGVEMDTETNWTTCHRSAFAPPSARYGGSETPAPHSAQRHMGAMPRRVTPHVYVSVFNRDPREPPNAELALPRESHVTTRGAAAVPTKGDWATPSRIGESVLRSPRLVAQDEALSLELMEAKIRSERRLQNAALALAAEAANR